MLCARRSSLGEKRFVRPDGSQYLRDSLGNGLPDGQGQLDAVLLEGLALDADEDNRGPVAIRRQALRHLDKFGDPHRV